MKRFRGDNDFRGDLSHSDNHKLRLRRVDPIWRRPLKGLNGLESTEEQDLADYGIVSRNTRVIKDFLERAQQDSAADRVEVAASLYVGWDSGEIAAIVADGEGRPDGLNGRPVARLILKGVIDPMAAQPSRSLNFGVPQEVIDQGFTSDVVPERVIQNIQRALQAYDEQ